MVRRSARAWRGFYSEDMAFITGTFDPVANSSTIECPLTRATIMETIEDMTRAESYSVSLTYLSTFRRRAHTPNWISSFPKDIGCPPNSAIADSVLTRVRVLRLLKIIPTDYPANGPGVKAVIPGRSSLFFTDCFISADRARMPWSSGTERSAIESR
jgi:hypothetical protein